MAKNSSKIFSVLPYFSPTADFSKTSQLLEKVEAGLKDHMLFLRCQLFCLLVNDFFKDNPEVQEVSLGAAEVQDGNNNTYIFVLAAIVSATSKFYSHDGNASNFFSQSMGAEDKSRLCMLSSLSSSGDDVVFNRTNLEDGFSVWMGEENWKKWQSLYTEEALLGVVDTSHIEADYKIASSVKKKL